MSFRLSTQSLSCILNHSQIFKSETISLRHIGQKDK